MARFGGSQIRCGRFDKAREQNVDGEDLVLCRRNGQGELAPLTEGLDNVIQLTQSISGGVEPTPSALHDEAFHDSKPLMQLSTEHGHQMAVATDDQTSADTDASALSHPSEADASDSEDVDSRRRVVSQRLRLDDTAAIADRLFTLLKTIQQQACKRIAKAWVKGICPKKQSRYPYQNRARRNAEGLPPQVPEWWPQRLCEFREPDHINKDNRLRLCLWLLRIRPTPEKFREWNGSGEVLKRMSWTRFLETLTPPSIFDNLDPNSPAAPDCAKRAQMEGYLKALYRLADMEESYMNGERDGSDEYCWTEDVPVEPSRRRRTVTAQKRVRRSSLVAGKRSRSTDRSPGLERVVKRARGSKAKTSRASPNAQLILQMSSAALEDSPAPYKIDEHMQYSEPQQFYGHGLPQASASTPFGQPLLSRSQMKRLRTSSSTPGLLRSTGLPDASYHRFQPEAISPASTTFNLSFGAMTDVPCDAPSDVWSTHRQDVSIASHHAGPIPTTRTHQQQPENLDVYPAYDIPQPQFDIVPNTPSFPIMNGFAAPSAHVHHGAPASKQLLSAERAQPGFTPDMSAQQCYPDQIGSCAHPQHDILVSMNYPPGNLVMHEAYPQAPPAQHGYTMDSDPDPAHNPQHPCSTVQLSQHEVHQPHYRVHPNPWPEVMPASNFPSQHLPASMVRGFTGHGSGVGGHAMT